MVQFDSYNIIGRAGVPAALATRRPDQPGRRARVGLAHLVAPPVRLEHLQRDQVHRLLGLLRPDAARCSPRSTTMAATGSTRSRRAGRYAADRGRHQVNASISHFAEKWGRHDLKFGVEIERSRVRDRNYYINGNYYYNYGGAPYYAYSGSNYDVSGRNRRESVFVQDAWKPNDRLTLNLGVRIDHVSGGAPDADSVYSNTMVAPRLGFAFDLTGKGTTVLKGSYSQYYEGIFNDLYKLATPGYEDNVGWDMSGCPGLRSVRTDCRLSLPPVAAKRGEPAGPADSERRRRHQAPARRRVQPGSRAPDWPRLARVGDRRLPREQELHRQRAARRPLGGDLAQHHREHARRGLRRLQRLAGRPGHGLPLDQPCDLDGQRVHHEPRRLPVPRPERQRGRDDGRLPQVPGA